MRIFYFLCFFLLSILSKAQFTKGYAPPKWNMVLSPGSNSSVNTADAPNSITIIGSNGTQADNVDVDYTITALATGVFAFSWSYHTNDSYNDPQYDIAGVLIGGTFTQLTDNTGDIDQSGHFSRSVTAGTVIGFRLRAIDNIEGNATFTISAFSPPGGVLPVRLLSFTAQKQNAVVQLKWSSASETAFSHFVVERSVDATNFSSLKTVKAVGQNGQYSLADEHPFAGINFYRLKMVDNNGTAAYSKIITVDIETTGQFYVSPNPAKDQFTVCVHTSSASIETIIITNMAGVTVAKQNISLGGGINHHRFNINSFAKGIYLVRLQTSGLTTRLIKQ